MTTKSKRYVVKFVLDQNIETLKDRIGAHLRATENLLENSHSFFFVL